MKFENLESVKNYPSSHTAFQIDENQQKLCRPTQIIKNQLNTKQQIYFKN